MSLEWKQTFRDQTITSDRQIWQSVCGTYRVVCSHIRFGDLPIVFYAMVKKETPNGFCWDIISKHRKKNPATASVEKYERAVVRAARKLERLKIAQEKALAKKKKAAAKKRAAKRKKKGKRHDRNRLGEARPQKVYTRKD